MLNLKKARKKKGYTQQEVADTLKITRAAYTNIENEKRNPDTNTLIALSNIFDVSVDYLLGIDNKSNEHNELHNSIDNLNDDSKQELEKFIELLKTKEIYENNKNTKSEHIG